MADKVLLKLEPLPLIGIQVIHFLLKYVMHVPGLKKNLVSVAMLEDRAYDVVFREGKAFL